MGPRGPIGLGSASIVAIGIRFLRIQRWPSPARSTARWRSPRRRIDQVLDDPDLTGLVGARRRPGVQALVLGLRILLVPELAAVAEHREERIVQALDDDREVFF
jgi:hypothetical protein